ncbi:sugar ABC transporter substrate-binding protein [Geobacillus sp. 47C-IIb]|jgi:raffinose/stachyose/melibiose transport system substrate-binding protein|uniref:extracellular solute-binding protein n=1 Tax=Geobacillus TaxID=129337 RepID=UPI0009BD3991|nr:MULTISPECIES: extracellular solute-binding protein [Geobacillus]ARP44289.1 putative ABC transporter extracellular-binding protein [Geobacillus thermodenitrificans]ATO37686.1 sugar ABC transporter substrate-binding protein [Geobacillus thermodenitrificans]OQP08521.1 sugar ABC transporter substrate-binding protein [Geobacillus sp. 47C-IIb]QNU32733.1 extracellular solute-binding protein [Geobacillus sp. 47C-IIb]
MRRVGLVVLSLLLLLALAACNDGGEEKASGDKNGVIELTLWTDWTEDRPENTVYKDMISKFNEQHDDIKIVLETIPHDQYETKLRTQAAGNQLPDMMRVWPGERTSVLVESGALLPLDPIIDQWKESIPESILDDYAVKGSYYAIPSNVSLTSLIFYNKELLKKAGYSDFPTTYEDLKKLIVALNKEGITPISLGNKATWPLQSVYISTIADRFTGSDFLPNVLSGNGSFVDKNFIQALSVIDELTKLNAFNEDMNTIDEATARNEFIKGSAAMHFAGSWAIGPILDNVENIDNIGVAPLPTFEGGKGEPSSISGVAGGGIALSSQLTKEEQEAAFEFLKFYYSETLYQNLVKANIIVPVNVEMDSQTPAIFKTANSFVQGGLAPVYDATLPAELTDIINNGLQAITLGEKSPKELAKEMQDALEKMK